MAKKVLIIEDYPATAEMIGNILKTEGIEVMTAYDGGSGLEKARSFAPDLILLDVMMPEVSGWDVCKQLKEDKQTAQIPVIMVSVRAGDDSAAKGKELGAIDYIPKPFNPFQLVEIVKKYL
jgi:DNA-binding response OmpR family regulator